MSDKSTRPRIVLVAGTYDLGHDGHLESLRKARKIAGEDGKLICAVNSDEFAQAYKRPPSQDQETRRKWVESTGIVDEAIINPGFSEQFEMIKKSGAQVFLSSADWADPVTHAQQLYVPSMDVFWEAGIVVAYTARTSGVSTTELLRGA